MNIKKSILAFFKDSEPEPKFILHSESYRKALKLSPGEIEAVYEFFAWCGGFRQEIEVEDNGTKVFLIEFVRLATDDDAEKVYLTVSSAANNEKYFAAEKRGEKIFRTLHTRMHEIFLREILTGDYAKKIRHRIQKYL